MLANCGGSPNSPAQAQDPPAAPSAVALSKSNAGLTPSQQWTVSATTTDGSQVSWSISPSGGSIDPSSSASGANVTLTAPATAGVYTVTATRNSAGAAASASATVAVTDLPGVYTYHNDLARSGGNDQEYLLTPATVSGTSFGKLFSCVTDGAIYAQPLWVAALTVGGVKRNVLFVATQHDSVFAFDADQNPCVPLWNVSLLDAAHGASPGEMTVISAGLDRVVGNGAGSITPETGITGTPVIDPATGTLYVVSKSMTTGDSVSFYQRLHALDLTTGQEKPGSPVEITASFSGSGDTGSSVPFNPQTQLQRTGLAFVNGSVYIAWASHEDTPPYYGWVIGYTYDGSSFKQASVFNVTPNAGLGGIWMSGAAPASADGRLYLMTGNGAFDADSAAPMPNDDYGDSLLELSSSLQVSQYFAPTDEDIGVPQDLDFGSGGAAVLVDLPATSPVAHLIAGGGKDGYLYVLNRDALGGKGDQHAWQKINIGGPILASPAFWNNQLYIAGIQAPLVAYQLDTTTAQLSLASSSTMLASGGYFGRTPSVSGAHGTGGIVWALNNYQVCTLNTQNAVPAENPCGPAILEAYDATNLQSELWSSANLAADTAGNAVRNAVPMIANGKVYIGTRGNNMGGPLGSTSAAGEVDVYGLR